MIFHWLFIAVIVGVIECENDVSDLDALEPDDYEGYGCLCPVEAIMYYSVSVRAAYTASVLSLKSSGIPVVSGFAELDDKSPDWLTNIISTLKEAYLELKLVIHRLLQDLQSEVDGLNGAVLYMAVKFYKSDVEGVNTDTLVGEAKDPAEAESLLTARKLESAYINFQTTIDELRAEFQVKCDSIPAEYGTEEYYDAALMLYLDAKKRLMQTNELYAALRDAFLLGVKINKCSGTPTTDPSLIGIYDVDDIAQYLKVTNKCPVTLLKTTVIYMNELYGSALTNLYLSNPDKSVEELALKIFIWEQLNIMRATTDLMYQELDCYITCTKDKAIETFGENSDSYNQVMSKLFVSVSTRLITIIKCTRVSYERANNYSPDGSMISPSQSVNTKNIDLLYNINLMAIPRLTNYDYRSIFTSGQNNGKDGPVSVSNVNTNGQSTTPPSGNVGYSQVDGSMPKTVGNTQVKSSSLPLMVNKCILQSIVYILSNMNAQIDTTVPSENDDIEKWIFNQITLREFYGSIMNIKQIVLFNKINLGSSEVYLYAKFQSPDSDGYIGSLQQYTNDILESMDITIRYMSQPMSTVDDYINLQSINTGTSSTPYLPGQITTSKPRSSQAKPATTQNMPNNYGSLGISGYNNDDTIPKTTTTKDMPNNYGSLGISGYNNNDAIPKTTTTKDMPNNYGSLGISGYNNNDAIPKTTTTKDMPNNYGSLGLSGYNNNDAIPKTTTTKDMPNNYGSLGISGYNNNDAIPKTTTTKDMPNNYGSLGISGYNNNDAIPKTTTTKDMPNNYGSLGISGYNNDDAIPKTTTTKDMPNNYGSLGISGYNNDDTIPKTTTTKDMPNNYGSLGISGYNNNDAIPKTTTTKDMPNNYGSLGISGYNNNDAIPKTTTTKDMPNNYGSLGISGYNNNDAIPKTTTTKDMPNNYGSLGISGYNNNDAIPKTTTTKDMPNNYGSLGISGYNNNDAIPKTTTTKDMPNNYGSLGISGYNNNDAIPKTTTTKDMPNNYGSLGISGYNNNDAIPKTTTTKDMPDNNNNGGTTRPNLGYSRGKSYMIKTTEPIKQTIDAFLTSFSYKFSILSNKLSSEPDETGIKTAVEKSLNINKDIFEYNTLYLQNTCSKWISHIEQTMSADLPADLPAYLDAINNIYIDMQEIEGVLASFCEIPMKRASIYSMGITEYILIEQSVSYGSYVRELYAFFETEIPNTDIDDGDDPEQFLTNSVTRFTQIITLTQKSLSQLSPDDSSRELFLWQLEQVDTMFNDNVNNLKRQVTEVKAIFGDSPSSLSALYIEIQQRTETLIAVVSGPLIKSYSYCKTTTDFSVFESETMLIINESTFTSYNLPSTTVYQETETIYITTPVEITEQSYTETTISS